MYVTLSSTCKFLEIAWLVHDQNKLEFCFVSNGLNITPITGFPLIATQTMVVTYCSKFSKLQITY